MGYRIKADGSLEFPEEDQVEQFFKEDENRRELFKSLSKTPNGRFFAARMTLLDKLSNHEGGPRVVLNAKGANLPSLIGKPVHFTKDFTAHFGEADMGSPKVQTFGVTLGGRVHDRGRDGSIPLDVFGILWDDDHPEAVETVLANMAAMGMSWEIVANMDSLGKFDHPDHNQESLWIGEYDFGGTAILRRDHAAYPDSYLLMAGKDGKDTVIDMAKVPEVRVPLKAQNTTVETPIINWDPAPKQKLAPGPDPSTEDGMFCKDCSPKFEASLQKGDLIKAEDLQSQQKWAALEKERDVALQAAKDATEALTESTKVLKETKEAAEAKDRRVTAQTNAIEDWEKVKGEFSDDEKVRTIFLAARTEIHLKEDPEKVAEAYESLLKLEAKKSKTSGREPLDALQPTVRKIQAGEDGLDDDEYVDDVRVPSAAQRAASRKFMQEKYNPAVLRAMVHGPGGFQPGKRAKAS